MNTCECSRHTQGLTGRTEVLSSEEISLTGDGCHVSSAEGKGIRKIYIYKEEGEVRGGLGKSRAAFYKHIRFAAARFSSLTNYDARGQSFHRCHREAVHKRLISRLLKLVQ